MCQFLSGIVLPNGSVETSDYTDAHELIVAHLGLEDDGNHLPGHPPFAPVECTSPDDPLNADSYQLHMDDNCERPVWLDDEMWGRVEATMKERIRQMIITTGEHNLLLGGKWFIGGDAVIKRVVGAYIVDVRSGTIGDVRGGTIGNVSGGTIGNVWGGTIENVRGGTIENVRGGTIENVSGGTIENVRGGTIGNVSGGTIGNVRGGTIGNDRRTKQEGDPQ